MTTVKADIQAAERTIKRACAKAVRMYRAGQDRAAVAELLEHAGVAADVLLEGEAA